MEWKIKEAEEVKRASESASKRAMKSVGETIASVSGV